MGMSKNRGILVDLPYWFYNIKMHKNGLSVPILVTKKDIPVTGI
jgi:hypothetical protein